MFLRNSLDNTVSLNLSIESWNSIEYLFCLMIIDTCLLFH